MKKTFWNHIAQRNARDVVEALHYPPIRRLLLGAFLSNIGTWMQSVSQAWLVLQLTNSPFYLGLDGFAATLPLGIFAFAGGIIADRYDRQKLMVGTQIFLLLLACLQGLLISLGWIKVWHVIFFSFCVGLAQTIAWPTYQTILAELSPSEHLSNAIALNSTQFNVARMIGPVLGALAMSHLGMASSFYLNSLSFLFLIWAMSKIRIRPHEASTVRDVKTAFREGYQLMKQNRALFWLLFLMAMHSIFAAPLITMIPYYAKEILNIGAKGLGLLTGWLGVGAVLGGLSVAFLGHFEGKGRVVITCTAIYTAAMMAFAMSRHVGISVIALVLMGYSMIGMVSLTNSIVQMQVPQAMRGRAISIFVFAFGGCMPIGNLLAGTLSDHWGAPKSLIGMAIVFSVIIFTVFRKQPQLSELS